MKSLKNIIFGVEAIFTSYLIFIFFLKKIYFGSKAKLDSIYNSINS